MKLLANSKSVDAMMAGLRKILYRIHDTGCDSLTSVTRKIAAQIAMPSIHFLSARSSGMAAPSTVDSCRNAQQDRARHARVSGS